jgi:glycosyltransferase involved in cell wall biosynthesis
MGNVAIEHSRYNSSVSVALCTFQGSRYLREQLESIATQTLQPAELVVCDDGSEDDTLTLLADFASDVRFPVHIHRNETRLGSTQNFEKAILLCKGENIALCDQDDWWHPKKLEILCEVLSNSNAGGIFTNGLLMDDDSKLTGGSLWGENSFGGREAGFGEDGDCEDARAALLRNNMVTGATVMFRSSQRDKILPFPSEWVHDGWLAWMLVLRSRLRAVSEPLIHYRVHQSQQVGVPGQSVKARLRRARATGMRDYLSIERQFEVLLEYVRLASDLSRPDLVRQLEQKRDLVGFRGRLPTNRLKRWGNILGQVSEYRSYAQGYKSMIKDALV